MKHAVKLDYPIDMGFLAEATITPFRDYAVLQRYSKGLPGDYDVLAKCGWSAKNKSVSNEKRLIEQLPSKLLSLEYPYVLLLELPAIDTPNPVLPAHRDYGKKTSINIYLETSGETTTFYHWNRETQKSDFEEEFCAATNEIWLMDTDTPHSVTLKPNKARRLLSMCFAKLKYAEVLECFATK
jgi:hypothetical protein